MRACNAGQNRDSPNNSTLPSAEPNLFVALQTYCPYWRFSIVITLTVVSVSSSAVAK